MEKLLILMISNISCPLVIYKINICLKTVLNNIYILQGVFIQRTYVELSNAEDFTTNAEDFTTSIKNSASSTITLIHDEIRASQQVKNNLHRQGYLRKYADVVAIG